MACQTAFPRCSCAAPGRQSPLIGRGPLNEGGPMGLFKRGERPFPTPAGSPQLCVDFFDDVNCVRYESADLYGVAR